ncbi:LapA family protein [candidate division WOR-3 bacterium]|nr:LapA family protein [candidate division WOR-3 bacterium]
MTLIISVVVGILLILGIIVGSQNGNTFVNFYLLKWKFEDISLTLLVIESILIGFILTMILSGVNSIKMKLQMREIVKENRNLQKEIKALKNLPFEEEEGEGTEEVEEIVEEDEDEEKEEETIE